LLFSVLLKPLLFFMKARLIELAPQYPNTVSVKKLKENHFTTPFHFHDYCELNYVKKSHGKRVVGDSIHNFLEGDLVLMSPNLPHMWYNDPEIFKKPSSLSAEAIVTYFPLDFLDKLSSDNIVLSKKQNLFNKAKRGLAFYGETKKMVIKHLETMIKLDGLLQVIEFLKIINILLNSKEYKVLSSLGYSHSYNEKDTERMNSIYKYIMQHFTEPITLKNIADIAHMTSPAFCNYFKKRTQKSFSGFLNEVRIGHACKLLQNEELSVSDVCFESGYQNIANFNRFFKKIINKKPSSYRKEYLMSLNRY
jgi:AraC-like DNA-binding protein